MLVKSVLSLFIILFYTNAFGQDYTWWNNKHQWDGHTHWTRYIIYSPGYMGPNALPVPPMNADKLEGQHAFEWGTAGFLTQGERTANLFYRGRYDIGNGLAAIEISHIAVEYYQLDSLIRDERRARSYEATGFAVGDVNITTLLTILKNHASWPDMVLRINLRTASGGKLSDARHTNSPGYFFDLSMGKDLELLKEKPQTLRWYGMLGFYVWQTDYTDNRQNDALLAGSGLSISGSNYRLAAETAGYFGYRNERDSPLVVRLMYEVQHNNTKLKLMYQKGVHDIYHHHLSLSTVLLF